MRLAPFKSFGRLYILIYFLTFLQPVYSQSELPIDEDPYLDPDGIKALSSNQGFSENQGIIIGILYGLHPALVFSPALSLGYYNEPFAVGVEISDSDKLEFWSKQKKEWLGPSRFGGSTVFGKLFFGQNMYLVSAYEKRFAISPIVPMIDLQRVGRHALIFLQKVPLQVLVSDLWIMAGLDSCQSTSFVGV